MSSVILPGSYDPVTLGHLAVIREAASRYDEVYVVVFVNPDKKYTFSLDERVRMLMLATDDIDNVLVSYSDGLVIDYMREHGIEKIFKGYRNDADLEYEKKMAEWNFEHGGYETELWKCPEEIENISSTAVRECLKVNNGAEKLLPECVLNYIYSCLDKRSRL
jgi:pantetheine-phosphate adenylyltransferase